MIRIEIKNDTVGTSLARLVKAMTDLTPLMDEMGELMVARTEMNFKTGTSPDGVAWAPKSQATLDAYRRRKDGSSSTRPLIGPTGLLSKTIHHQATPHSVSWGSNMIYAAVMQLGAQKGAFGKTRRNGPIPWGNIPARPYLGVGAEDETALLEVIGEYLENVLGD